MHDKTSDIGAPADGVSRATFDVANAARASVVLIPLALWIWLCWDWPARLGFYSDDWMVLLHPFVGTAESFYDTLKLVATRPVSAPFIWLAQVLVDWSPVRSQLLNITMLLVTAASVGVLAAAVIARVFSLKDGKLVCASIAAASFIVFPSNVGTFAWGTGTIAIVPALPLFCLATSTILHAERSWTRLCVGLVLALLSHLSYEAFYFQEIAFVLIAVTLRGGGKKEIPWRVVSGVIAVNIGCLVFNRLAPSLIHKTFRWEFFQIFMGGYSHILYTLGHATREHVDLIASSVLVAVLLGTICLVRTVGIFRIPIVFAIMACGIIASGLLYAFAGYGLAVEGPMARVGIVLATYCSVMMGLLAAAAWCTVERHRLIVLIFSISASLGLVTLDLTARARVREWADTWSYETARLSRLPASITSQKKYLAGDERIYIAIADRPASFIEPAAAPWEIGGAIAWAAYQKTGSRLLMIHLWKQKPYRWFAALRGWFNRWDGYQFEQGPCGGNAAYYSAFGTELWVWNSSTGELNKIDALWEHGCR